MSSLHWTDDEGGGPRDAPPLRFIDSFDELYFMSPDKLGSGSFGEVFLCWRKLPRRMFESDSSYEKRCQAGEPVAVKRLKPRDAKLAAALQKCAAAFSEPSKLGVARTWLRGHRKSVTSGDPLAVRSAKSLGAQGRRMSAPGVSAGPAACAEAAGMKAGGEDAYAATCGLLDAVLVKDRHNMNQEAEYLKRVRGHNHVVTILEHLDDGTFIYIVMEYARGGDLMRHVSKCHNFSESIAAYLFRQMLLAVLHCHSCGVVHRDLKPEQFLFVREDGKVSVACDCRDASGGTITIACRTQRGATVTTALCASLHTRSFAARCIHVVSVLANQ